MYFSCHYLDRKMIFYIFPTSMVPPIGNERIVSMLACPHALHAGGGIKTIVAKRICIEPYRSLILSLEKGGGGGEELLPQIIPGFS